MFAGFFKWYERLILYALVFVNTFMPMAVIIKLNRWFVLLMAKNPKHALSKRMAELMREGK